MSYAQELPSNANYLYPQKSYVDSGSDYSLLGNYNNVNPQFVTGPPIISETKVQIVPSYGGTGYPTQSNPGGSGNYFILNNAYCCGQNTCSQTTQPVFSNVGMQIYGKAPGYTTSVPLTR